MQPFLIPLFWLLTQKTPLKTQYIVFIVNTYQNKVYLI